jgi:hypothetical protein
MNAADQVVLHLLNAQIKTGKRALNVFVALLKHSPVSRVACETFV